MRALEPLSAEAIRAGLETEFVGRNLVFVPEVSSTNDTARNLAQGGAPEGTLVITDYQTAGRGRLARRWEAPPRSSLLLTLVFRPPLAPHEVQRLTMVCGLAVVEAVEAETGLKAGLKWPNDVLIQGAKVGGILTELTLTGDRLDFAIVGIGLNVNLDPEELPGDLLTPATSLSQATGLKVMRLSLLWSLLRSVEARYISLVGGHAPQAEWAKRLVTLGRPVTVSGAGFMLEGVAEGVTADGALLVRCADGRVKTVLAGDVTLQA